MIWLIAIAAIAGVLFRPNDWPEAVWAGLGALLLVVTRLITPSSAAAAIGKGLDVYLFLTGMMLLAELARIEGVFDWLAGIAVRAARGSSGRLFALIYLVGIGVTVFLSNDATAVVLTPAVYAAVKHARAKALPYLLSCAFIANAASFVLPISNPANLVVYGKTIPPLFDWLKIFALPSIASILVTYAVLRCRLRGELSGRVADGSEPVPLTRRGRDAAWGIVVTGGILMASSARGFDLGLPTCIAASLSVLIATRANARAVAAVGRGVSWSVLPLVAGLFVIVEALNQTGASQQIQAALRWATGLAPISGAISASFGIAALSNLMNNLPSGLLAGGALQSSGTAIPHHIRDAVLIGVDLGPNLSVTGSLATILWLIALRREGERISAWQFLKIGALVMTPALLLSTVLLALFST